MKITNEIFDKIAFYKGMVLERDGEKCRVLFTGFCSREIAVEVYNREYKTWTYDGSHACTEFEL
jgi:hypothetical protein